MARVQGRTDLMLNSFVIYGMILVTTFVLLSSFSLIMQSCRPLRIELMCLLSLEGQILARLLIIAQFPCVMFAIRLSLKSWPIALSPSFQI